MTTEARAMFPPPDDRRHHTIWLFKRALIEQYGIAEAFRIYKEMFELPDSTSLRRGRISSVTEYARERAVEFTEIYPAGEPFTVPFPKIVGVSEARILKGSSRSFYVACLENAEVWAGSTFVRAGGRMMLDYEGGEFASFDDNVDVDPLVFHADGNDAWFVEHDLEPIEIDEAFSFFGPYQHSIGHWLWQHLPRYVAARESGALPPVPLVLSDRLEAPERGTLDLIVPSDTKRIEVSCGPLELHRPVRIRRLWIAPTLFYEPYFERINPRYPGPAHRCFPSYRFRPVLDAMARSAEGVPPAETGPRVFLARRAEYHRRMVNDVDIEALARERGFSIVYPEDYPFAQQAAFVRDARFVMGPEGSAMYLNFYARPGAKLCVLCHANVSDLQTYAHLLMQIPMDVTVFTGPAVRRQAYLGLDYWQDYEIDRDEFVGFFDRWLMS